MKTQHFIRQTFEELAPYSGLNAARDLLPKHSCLVIRDSERYYGILTAEDIVKNPRNLVIDCLTAKPSVSPEASIDTALEIMKQSGNMVLPVFDADNFLGIVRQNDLEDFRAEQSLLLEQEVTRKTAELEELNKKLLKEIKARLESDKESARLKDHLRQTQKLEAIGTLAGGIAHDFNNLLTIILGYAEILQETIPIDDSSNEALRQIQLAALRARDLTQQILTFSRKNEKERKPLLLTALVKETVKLLRSSLPAAITVEEEYSDELPAVCADPSQINQIVMNLAVNAAHSMKLTGGMLHFSLKPHEISSPFTEPELSTLEPGFYVCLTVIDTGSGINPEIIDRIFEPYFTTKAAGEGTGLGLSVVHGIVKASGGEIIVNSLPGKGSTFRIFFPEAIMPMPLGVPGSADSLPRGGGNDSCGRR